MVSLLLQTSKRRSFKRINFGFLRGHGYSEYILELLRNYGLYHRSERSDSSESQVPTTEDSDHSDLSDHSVA